MPDLHGKVVLVTGAGRGSGRDVAIRLAAYGATIAANDISPLNVDQVSEQIIAYGSGQVRVYLHDVAKKVAVQTMVNEIIDDFGHIDLLINNANVEQKAGLLDMDEWDLHRTFEVNTIGTFLTMQSVGRVMREQGGGMIINLLGTGENEQADAIFRSAYLASRLAVAGLTQKSAQELSRHNIQVYGVAQDMDELSLPEPVFFNVCDAILALCEFHTIANGAILKIR